MRIQGLRSCVIFSETRRGLTAGCVFSHAPVPRMLWRASATAGASMSQPEITAPTELTPEEEEILNLILELSAPDPEEDPA